jgi:protein involved in sex pheromone biosynthesis
MKKFLTLFLTAMMLIVLAACGGGNDNAGEDASAENGDQEQAEAKVIKAGIRLNDQHPQYKY